MLTRHLELSVISTLDLEYDNQYQAAMYIMMAIGHIYHPRMRRLRKPTTPINSGPKVHGDRSLQSNTYSRVRIIQKHCSGRAICFSTKLPAAGLGQEI